MPITQTTAAAVTITDTYASVGGIKIIKRSEPRGVDQDFNFTSSISGAQLSCTSDTSPANFTLNDEEPWPIR